MKKSSLLILAMHGVVAVAQSPTDTVALDPTKVQALTFRGSLEEQGRNITYIEARELRMLPVVQWDDILRFVPGMEVQARGGFGSQADITLRGSTFQQVLVLVDGMRINDPLTGHFNGNIPVVPCEIDHLEVIKGPAALNYGPEAVGGVIHVITRAYAGKAHLPGTQISGSLTGGEWNYLGMQLHTSATSENMRHVLGASFMHNSSTGQLLSGDSLRGDFDNSMTALSYSGRPSRKIHLHTRLSGSLYDFNARFFYTRSTADRSREYVRRVMLQQSIRINHSQRHYTELNAAAQRTTDSFLFNPAFVGNFHTLWLGQLQGRHIVNAEDGRWNWHSGFQYFLRDISSTDRGIHQEQEAALWTQAYWKPESLPLKGNGGLRLTRDALGLIHLTPQLNAVCRASPVLSLRSGFSRSFRNPDFTERYVSTGLPGLLGAGRNLGNPNLRPEFALNYEVGADLRAGKSWRFSSTLFLRESENLIDFLYIQGRFIPPSPKIDTGRFYFYAQNLTPLNTRGAELDIRWNGSISQDLSGFFMAGLTALQFRSADGNQGISKYVASNAGFLANAQLGLRYRKFNLGWNGLYKSRSSEQAQAINKELVPEYFVMNALAEWEYPEFPLRFRLQCQNLSNVRYSDIMGAELPRRWWMIGLHFRF
jgi:iron complex outermembrane receptor protein